MNGNEEVKTLCGPLSRSAAFDGKQPQARSSSVSPPDPSLPLSKLN